MTISERLAGVRQVEHLADLVAALGYRSAMESIPTADWLGIASLSSTSEVARLTEPAEFPWYGVETRDTHKVAPVLAGRLADRGEVAAVIALNTERRALTIAIAFAGRHTVDMSLDEPEAAVNTCLDRLSGGSEPTKLGTAAKIARVLGGEAVGARFFAAFKRAFLHVADDIGTGVPKAHRRHLALLQLTRVLFLYFVQAKGWLDGQPDFLRAHLDGCLGRRRSVHHQFLQPLFFGTLNLPTLKRRPSARRFGRIPFLNGGLFEPHPLERRYRVGVTNGCWRDVFDNLFERFYFTVSENRDPTAIAPDMLGRVFEGLMQADERKASGSFYTPTSLVREFLEPCFGAFAAQHTGMALDAATDLVRDRSATLRPVWPEVTVLDPAAGSGAFLLGALDILTELRFGMDRRPGASKRQVLQRHLFGVDKDPMAVRLAELRLWLAIVCEEPDGMSANVRPLPNLDCLVRQGDSLHDPLGALSSLSLRPRIDAQVQSDLRRQVYLSQASNKAGQATRLREAETRAMHSCLRSVEETLRLQLADHRAAAGDRTLFGERRGPDRALRHQVKVVRERIRQVRRYQSRLDEHGELPWFQFEGHFGDVFARRGGFDMVVGNPPWVRAEELSRHDRRTLRDRYRWWRGNGGRGYAHLPDLALAFLERGLELTAPNGVIGFLLPAKMLTARYAQRARSAMASNTTLYYVADLTRRAGDLFGATAYPLALIAGKVPPKPDHRTRGSFDEGVDLTVPQRQLVSSGPWYLQDEGIIRLLDQLRTYPTLAEQRSCHLGVKTGANKVFLDPSVEAEPAYWRDAVRGRDIEAWRVESTTRLLWPYDADGTVLEELPGQLRDYFESRAPSLIKRADYRGGPVWQLFRTGPTLAEHRVVWADLSTRLNAAPLVDKRASRLVPLNTCYVTGLNSGRAAVCLAAWLNSTVIRAIAKVGADIARGGYSRFNARAVGSIPCPPEMLDSDTLYQLGVGALRGDRIQEKLDAHVVDILSLSDAALAAAKRVV